MSGAELLARVAALAAECEELHPEVAGVLYQLCGSMAAGPAALRRTFDVNTELSREAVQFFTGKGETIQ